MPSNCLLAAVTVFGGRHALVVMTGNALNEGIGNKETEPVIDLFLVAIFANNKSTPYALDIYKI